MIHVSTTGCLVLDIWQIPAVYIFWCFLCHVIFIPPVDFDLYIDFDQYNGIFIISSGIFWDKQAKNMCFSKHYLYSSTKTTSHEAIFSYMRICNNKKKMKVRWTRKKCTKSKRQWKLGRMSLAVAWLKRCLIKFNALEIFHRSKLLLLS